MVMRDVESGAERGRGLGARSGRAFVAAGTAALVACLGACGAASSGTASSGTASSGTASSGAGSSGAAGAPTGPAPGRPSASGTGGCAGASGDEATVGTPMTLSEPDAGRTICVTTGQRVAVRLQGDRGRAWTVDVEGTALVAAADARATLPRGAQGASYRADHPGTARIVASRAVCPSPKPGEMACMAVAQSWSVSVLVR
jgi:hypothetical protein